MKVQGTTNIQQNLGEGQNGELTLPYFRIYYKATVITLWHTGMRINIQINEIDLRIQKYTLTFSQLIN